MIQNILRSPKAPPVFQNYSDPKKRNHCLKWRRVLLLPLRSCAPRFCRRYFTTLVQDALYAMPIVPWSEWVKWQGLSLPLAGKRFIGCVGLLLRIRCFGSRQGFARFSLTLLMRTCEQDTKLSCSKRLYIVSCYSSRSLNILSPLANQQRSTLHDPWHFSRFRPADPLPLLPFARAHS